jgi:hypothetical protein
MNLSNATVGQLTDPDSNQLALLSEVAAGDAA